MYTSADIMLCMIEMQSKLKEYTLKGDTLKKEMEVALDIYRHETRSSLYWAAEWEKYEAVRDKFKANEEIIDVLNDNVNALSEVYTNLKWLEGLA